MYQCHWDLIYIDNPLDVIPCHFLPESKCQRVRVPYKCRSRPWQSELNCGVGITCCTNIAYWLSHCNCKSLFCWTHELSSHPRTPEFMACNRIWYSWPWISTYWPWGCWMCSFTWYSSILEPSYCTLNKLKSYNHTRQVLASLINTIHPLKSLHVKGNHSNI